MGIFTKPDEQVFASQAKSNEVTEFPEIGRGWGITFEQTQGIPPMEWFNFLFKRIDEHMQYILQHGIPEWSQTQTYPVGAVVQITGQYYQALQENSGYPPESSTQYWKKWNIGQTEDLSIFMLSTAMHLNALNEEIRQMECRFNRLEDSITKLNKLMENLV